MCNYLLNYNFSKILYLEFFKNLVIILGAKFGKNLYKKFMNYSNRTINNIRIYLNINSTSSLKTSLLKYGAEYKKSNGRRGYITPPYKCPVLSNVI